MPLDLDHPPAQGCPGGILSRGANVMKAYWNNPLESATAFRAGMFRTGDVAYRDTAGLFYIVDRLLGHDSCASREGLFRRGGSRPASTPRGS
jgi:acyl-CoA synthetase (AMP-forming)/AMP-acid ligase II